jgi:putative RNA 2'-phosphotransferase
MNYVRLSQTIARALRHAPEDFGLTLDREGWGEVDDLLTALRRKRREWKDLSADDLQAMMQQSDKQRYQIENGKIRALYGHSIPEKIEKTPAVPPAVLYHGTAPDTAQIILAEGLKPMRRQYVHLSTDMETALLVGRRKAGAPVLLQVRAEDAHRAGVQFYLGKDDTWLADAVPPEFISRVSA